MRQGLTLGRQAPPAFLLDSRRGDGKLLVAPGRFDNRWAVVPQDMPSGTHLRAAGLEAVLVRSASVAPDLTHVLCRYQQAGLRPEHAPDEAASPRPLSVREPSGFRSLWYRIGVLAGFRRNGAGGFGGVVPQPGSAGHG